MKNYILQIDTATEICSVSLSLDGVLVDQLEASEPNVHASKLTVYIDELLQNNAVGYSDLRGVSVSMGPGSYTGLRIGVSTAKGLCYALDIPLLAINTLESMFNGFSANKNLTANSLYIPMLDARRMEVYMQVYSHNKELIQDTNANIISEESFENYRGKNVVLFGSGALKLKETFSSNETVIIAEDFKHSSASMSLLSHSKFSNNDFEDLVYFEPYYLKEFVASTPKKLL